MWDMPTLSKRTLKALHLAAYPTEAIARDINCMTLPEMRDLETVRKKLNPLG